MHLQYVLPHLCYEFLLLLNDKSKFSPKIAIITMPIRQIISSIRFCLITFFSFSFDALCTDLGFLFIACYYSFHNHIKQYQQVDHCKHLVMLDQVKSI